MMEREMEIMARVDDSPFDVVEIEILRLLKEAQDTKVTRIAAELGKDFEIAYGHCLLLSDEGIIEELHEGVPIKRARYPLEKVGFHLTEKGHKICNTFDK
jgi:predicted transcriptional regulator